MELILSDGTREYDFLADGDIYVQQEGIQLPVVSDENTYAEGSDSEGRTRIRSRATNSEAGSFSVYFKATNADDFWDAVDNLQELVLSAHRNKGTITYTPPGGVAVTFDLEAINVTDLPQKGVHLQQFHGEATVSFETKPYGRLAAQRLNVQDTYQEQVTALSPSIFLPLGASAGLTDLSGNGRNGTAFGGVTVGGATGPLTVDDGGATDFDGTNDSVTAYGWKALRNYFTDPSFEVTGPTWTGAYLGGTASTSSTDPYEGAQCGTITSLSNASGSGRYFTTGVGTADTGQTWKVSVRVKAQGPTDVGKVVSLYLSEANAAGSNIAGQFNVASVSLTEEWQELLVTRPFAHADADRASTRLVTVSNAFTWSVDTAFLGPIHTYAFHATGNEVQDSFAAKANGSPTTADTGQTYFHSYSTTSDAELRVVSGHLTNIVASGAGAGYSQLTLTEKVAVMGAKFKFNNTTTGSAIVLIAMEDSIAGGIVGGAQNSSFHYVVGPTTWAFQQIDAGTVTASIASGTYTALTADTEYTTEIILEDDRAYIQLPTGQMVVVNDSRIANNAPYAVWEVIQSNAATQAKGRFTEIWADSTPITSDELIGPFFPTSVQLAAGDAGWVGTANASESDYGPFANGTTRTFMGWAKRDTSSGYDSLLFGGAFVGGTHANIAMSSGSGNITFAPDNSTTTTWSSAAPANGVWFHWVVVFDEVADDASLYIDGELVSTQTNTGKFGGFAEIEIGSGSYFDGKKAWLSIHRSAPTASQIRNAYDAALAQITLDGPIDSFTVESIPGQVPALPVLTLDDASTQARNIVEVGVQHDFDPDNPEDLELDLAAGLTAQGGSSNTRAGSVATNIIRAALATTPISICKAASQTHKGLWKVRARVYPSATTVLVRLAWRAGDGPFAKEKWVAVPNSAGWFDLDLGTVNIKELPSGHTCEFRIEAKSTSGSPTVDVDIVECIPADSYTKLRGSTQIDTPSAAIVAVDDFSTQTAGAVTGKTPLLAPAGLWSGAGDADDFQVDTTNQRIYRSAVSDSAANNGRYLRCGSGTLAATTITADIFHPGTGSSTDRFGLMLRYVDTSNWLMCVYDGSGTSLSLVKRVAGAETTLATCGVAFRAWRTLTVGADTSGNVLIYECDKGGTPAPMILTLADSTLATAGAIASGGYGIYDATTTSASTRYYDNFSVSTLATSASIINPAINSGYGLDLKHNTALTDNSTGTSTGTTPIRQGNYPKLPPATRNSGKSRVVVRARRNDGELGFADEGLDDALTASLEVTPRVHLTGT